MSRATGIEWTDATLEPFRDFAKFAPKRENAMNNLRAFHNDPVIKEKYVARARGHRAADELRQSFGYWKEDFDGVVRGCAVGCTLHSSDHDAYETELGIPSVLAHLEDGIFERLDHDRAMAWPVDFLEAIPVGADLSKVGGVLLRWILLDEAEGILSYDLSENVKGYALRCARLFERRDAGNEPASAEWDGLYNDIWSDLRDLSALSALSDLSARSALRALSDLSDLRDLSALSALSDLSALRALSDLSALSALTALSALRALRALTDLRDLRAKIIRSDREYAALAADKLLEALRSAPVPESCAA